MALHRCHAFLLNPKFVNLLGFNADGDADEQLEHGMFIKQLVRKLHLVVFSSGDFAMVEGESGEEVYFPLQCYSPLPCYTPPCRATPTAPLTMLHPLTRSTFSRAASSPSSLASGRRPRYTPLPC